MSHGSLNIAKQQGTFSYCTCFVSQNVLHPQTCLGLPIYSRTQTVQVSPSGNQIKSDQNKQKLFKNYTTDNDQKSNGSLALK